MSFDVKHWEATAVLPHCSLSGPRSIILQSSANSHFCCSLCAHTGWLLSYGHDCYGPGEWEIHI